MTNGDAEVTKRKTTDDTSDVENILNKKENEVFKDTSNLNEISNTSNLNEISNTPNLNEITNTSNLNEITISSPSSNNDATSPIIKETSDAFVSTSTESALKNEFEVSELNSNDLIEIEEKRRKVLELKDVGNASFRENKFEDAISMYTKAIDMCGIHINDVKAVVLCNRAACYQKIYKWEAVIEDCGDAIENDKQFLKAYLRRLTAYEALKKWHDALRDVEAIMTMDSEWKVRNAERYETIKRLSANQLEKEKEEMMSKLKSYGNMFLGKFGLSTDNFKFVQNEEGSYNVSFVQNSEK